MFGSGIELENLNCQLNFGAREQAAGPFPFSFAGQRTFYFNVLLAISVHQVRKIKLIGVFFILQKLLCFYLHL
jgi:hypothetical protein